MTAARSFLLDTLQRVVDGGDLTTEELDAAIPNPRLLDRIEKDAWADLSRWAEDDDIRTRDEQYAGFKRDKLREHIGPLSF